MSPLSSLGRRCVATFVIVGGLRGALLAAEASVDVVSLPEFVVEERKAARPVLYAEVAGAQLLSLVSEKQARVFAEELQAQTEAVRLLVPEELRIEYSAPRLFILDDSGFSAGVTRDAVSGRSPDRELSKQSLDAFREKPTDGTSSAPVPMPSGTGRATRLLIAADRTLTDIDERAWYTACRPGEVPHIVPPEVGDGLTGSATLAWWARMSLDFLLSRVAVAHGRLALTVASSRGLVFPSGEEFFDGGPGNRHPSPNVSVPALRNLVALWALTDGDSARAAGFWQLARRSVKEPVTDQMLKQTLGVDYAGLQTEIGAFVKKYDSSNSARLFSVTREIPTPKPINFAKVTFHPATRAELAVGKSEWERLSALRLRRNHELTEVPPILDQATRRLEHARRDGLTSPAISAVLGLIECDRGDDAKARPYLEEAAAAKLPRPRIYYELARIQSREAIATSSNGLITDDQSTAIFSALRTSSTLRPVPSATHPIVVDAALRSGRKLTPDELALLATSARAEPRQTALTYRAALVFAREGKIEEAKALADLALVRASETEVAAVTALKDALARGTGFEAEIAAQIKQILQR